MRACFLVIVCLLICPIVARAEAGPRLPAVFTDHMVLQRDRSVPVWGWANPDEEVSVEFAGQKKTAKSDANGRWMVRLDPLPASAEPRDLVVECAASQLKSKIADVLWIRKEVTLPEIAAGKPFSLSLNWMNEQYDTAYFNGVEIGRANDKPPTFYNMQRRYTVPGELVTSGRNVIAVRIVSATQFAGVWQWGHMLDLPVPDRDAIDDAWQTKTESTFAPLPADALASRPKPNTIAFRNVSSALYNGMIAPLMPFAIRGVIWYQGENNAGRATEYRDILSLLIRDWRGQWGQGDFPFIIQQLVNNGRLPADANAAGNWPLLREAQVQVAATVPNCGIAIGIELGSASTIHPPNKQDVGRRLALVALEKVCSKPVESSGPCYESMKIEGATIRVRFSHAAGLVAKDGPPRTFAIAGADRKFVWADAAIEGDAVVVSSPRVPEPVAVRYAWADNPPGCNLFNAAGLPMAPFRTDEWTGK